MKHCIKKVAVLKVLFYACHLVLPFPGPDWTMQSYNGQAFSISLTSRAPIRGILQPLFLPVWIHFVSGHTGATTAVFNSEALAFLLHKRNIKRQIKQKRNKTALCLNCAVRTVYQLGPINEHSATQTNLSELRTALLGNQVVFATLLLTYAVRSNSLSGHYDSVLPTVH